VRYPQNPQRLLAAAILALPAAIRQAIAEWNALGAMNARILTRSESVAVKK
jgi:hypothetical protein